MSKSLRADDMPALSAMARIAELETNADADAEAEADPGHANAAEGMPALSAQARLRERGDRDATGGA